MPKRLLTKFITPDFILQPIDKTVGCFFFRINLTSYLIRFRRWQAYISNMKKAVLLCGMAIQLLAACQSQPAQPIIKATAPAADGFAVVELFTSQGCSSCPSADALLGIEISTYAKAGKKLIALSFHVDYWNRLGWTDPFSQHLFSQRQYGYSAKMKGDGVYTPQAIVNGEQGAVGSNQGKVEGFINTAIAKKSEASLVIATVETKGNSLDITYQYTGPTAELQIAVVEKQINTPVKAGENEGRTLTNYNVVKSWKTTAAENGSHLAEIETPAGYKASEYAVVIYAQEKDYGKVLAVDMR